MSSKKYTDLGRRIAEAFARSGLNQTKFARLAHVTQGGVSRFLTGKDRIPEDKLIAWAKLLNDDFGLPWLTEHAKLQFVPVTIEGEVAAGAPIEFFQDPTKPIFNLPPEVVRPGCVMSALRVRGDSMVEEGIFDGDILVVSKGCKAENGQIVIAFVPDDGITVKRFREDRRVVELRPANKNYQPLIFHKGEDEMPEIQGIVTGLLRLF